MARRNRFQRRARPSNKQPTQIRDGIKNFVADLGAAQPNNQMGYTEYEFNPITRNRTKLDFMYRGSWIAASAIDIPAEDMTRASITIDGLDPLEADKITDSFSYHGLWASLCESVKWSRLYGGAIAYLVIEGQDPETPLDISTIGPGQFKGIMVFDRWMLNLGSSTTQVIKMPCSAEEFGLPVYYDVFVDKVLGDPGFRIHHSRVIRFTGIDLPYWQRMAEMNWGESILEKLYDRLVAFDSATVGVSQLTFKSHLRHLKVDGLRELIAIGGPAYEDFKAYMANFRLMQTNEGVTVLDKKDEFETFNYSFGGLSDVLTQLAMQISGALQIPMTRLFGISPGGLNATGDSDISHYVDSIHRQQEMRLRSPITKLLHILSRSELGKDLPEGCTFKFNSLKVMEDEDKAEVSSKMTDCIVKAFQAGIIDRKTALQELRAIGDVTGMFNNISDEEIDSANDVKEDEMHPNVEDKTINNNTKDKE